MSAQVIRLRLITADGRVRTLDAEHEPEVFRCARTALGTLGVLSTVTLRCVPQFNLRVSTRSAPLDTVLGRVHRVGRRGRPRRVLLAALAGHGRSAGDAGHRRPAHP